MADRVFNISIRINGEDNVSAVLDNVGKKASGLGGILANAAGVAGGIVLAKGFDLVAGAVTNAVTSAAAFETAMRNVNSIAKLNESGLAQISQQVIDLTKQVPQSAETLAKALYDIQSSGFDAAHGGLDILKASAMGASAGLSTTDVAARALTAVINAYGKSAGDASSIMDVMFKTVDRGVITFEELATNIGDVVGTANVAGVSFEQLGAAMATMTKGGISAAESATALNQLMLSFISPSDEAAKAAARLGIDMSASALAAKGLGGVMEEIRLKTGGSAEAMAELFPNVRALKGALALTRGEGKMFAEDMAAMGQATGATAKALAEQSKATAFQWQLLQNNLQAGALELGGHLLPVMNQFIQFVLKDGLPALGQFKEFLGAQLLPIFREVWSVVQPIIEKLVAGFTTFFGAIRTGSSPFAALVLALQTMGMSFQQSVGVMETVKGTLAAIGGFIQGTIVPALQQWMQWQVQVHTQLFGLATGIGAQVLPLLQQFAAWVTGPLLGALQTMATTIATAAMPTLMQMGGWISGTLLPALMQLGSWLMAQIVPALQWIGNVIVAQVIPALTQLGVFIFSTLLPQLGNLAMWFTTNLPVAIQFFMGVINALMPVAQALWNVITLGVQLFAGLGRIWMEVNRISQQFVSLLTQVVLKWAGIDTSSQAAANRLQAVGSVMQTVGSWIQVFVDGALRKLLDTLNGIIKALQEIVEWVEKAAAALQNFDPGSILKPGSPSPFEISLANTVEHLKALKHEAASGMQWNNLGAPMANWRAAELARAPASGNADARSGRAVQIDRLIIQPHDYEDFLRQFETATGIAFATGGV